MDKITILYVAAIIHIIGSIIAIIIHHKDGTFEWASKHGDGFRSATPSNIVFCDLLLWEITLLIFIMSFIDESINNFFKKIYKGV